MHWGFVIVGYLFVFASLAVYTIGLLLAGRDLSRKVPEERRRFLE